MTSQMTPQIIKPDEAETLRPFGIGMKVMMPAEHTGGSFSALVGEIKPGEGPPPHLHRDREEYFFVLEGTYDLSVNGSDTTIGPGTLVFVQAAPFIPSRMLGPGSGRFSNGPSPATTMRISERYTKWRPAAGSTPSG
jgi:hypothetical protein